MFRPLFQFWKSWILSVLCSDLLKYRDGVDMYKHQCSKPCIWHSNCKQRLIQTPVCSHRVNAPVHLESRGLFQLPLLLTCSLKRVSLCRMGGWEVRCSGSWRRYQDSSGSTGTGWDGLFNTASASSYNCRQERSTSDTIVTLGGFTRHNILLELCW